MFAFTFCVANLNTLYQKNEMSKYERKRLATFDMSLLFALSSRSLFALSLFNSRMLNFELNQKRDRGEGDLLLCLVIALRTRLGGDGDA